MSFKLPIDLIGGNKAVFLVTVEGIYIIGVFEWDVKRAIRRHTKKNVSHHEKFYILKSTPSAIKLRRELGAIQKDLQRLISKIQDSTKGRPQRVKEWQKTKGSLVEKAFQLVTTYLKNPPSPVIPFTPPKKYINEYMKMWKDFTPNAFRQNMQAASRRSMRHIGGSMEGKSIDEMRTPEINALQYVNYVAINYTQLPNQNRDTSPLHSTLLKAMARQYLK